MTSVLGQTPARSRHMTPDWKDFQCCQVAADQTTANTGAAVDTIHLVTIALIHADSQCTAAFCTAAVVSLSDSSSECGYYHEDTFQLGPIGAMQGNCLGLQQCF